ncbi:MAG: ribonuclease J, partial [Spirochaetota bacterium]
MRNTRRRNQKSTTDPKSIRVIPLGGLDAIGRNMTLFETDDTIIIVDCGIMFPTPEMPGIDFVIPDFTYLEQNKHKVKALFITHAHEDHIGAVPFLLKKINVPIYGSKLTTGFIKKRLEERPTGSNPVFNELVPGDLYNVGPFQIEPITVNHSIVDGMGLAIRNPVGTIVHTGDFKIDHTPEDGKLTDMGRFAHYGDEGVLLLMSDSTNAERPGYTGTEKKLNNRLFDIFTESKGRIIVATFASNINRIQQVLNTAQKYNRKVIISGRSMQMNIEIARSLGYLTYKDGLIVDLKEASTLPHRKQTIICTGTQGEPLSALTRISNGTHKHFKGSSGDTIVVTASVIPGNERTIGNVINSLLKLGATVHYERAKDLHVSGHASQEELKLMMSLTRPRFFMPIHGEYKHLRAHASIAEEMNIKPNGIQVACIGDILELTKRHFRKIGQIQTRTVYTEGNHIGDISSDIIRERQTISTEGVILVHVILSNGMLMTHPQFVTKGFSPALEKGFMENLEREINRQLDIMLQDKP